uniref:Uncharacterized protein n=1 Tax=Arundo donax TaxID=35708 RepID=A0A0A9EY00_ARUDO
METMSARFVERSGKRYPLAHYRLMALMEELELTKVDLPNKIPIWLLTSKFQTVGRMPITYILLSQQITMMMNLCSSKWLLTILILDLVKMPR